MRKLASIQKIVHIEAIPGADNIEVAMVLGWDVVIRKGEFKEGDLCVYFEIDSILPDGPEWSEFMRSRKFRVKTIKLRKQLSQGLALPLTSVVQGNSVFEVGTDLTEHLGVRKHDPQGDKERAIHAGQSKRNQPNKWLLRTRVGRWVHQKLYPRASGSWPEWFPKTDETRVQNISNLEKKCKDRYLYATEKLDGQSCTFFFNKDQKTGILSKGLFGVCSRNIWYKNKVANNWWDMADQLDIAETLERYCTNNNVSLAIQGEIIGEGIQGNSYGIAGKEFYVYNVYNIDDSRYLNLSEKLSIIPLMALEGVPHLIPQVYAPNEARGRKQWLDIADGYSYLTNPPLSMSKSAGGFAQDMSKKPVLREGIVIRDVEDDSFSFKAISNKWLFKGGE